MKFNSELEKTCAAEFGEFSQAISKCGFDGPGFAFMLIIDKKQLVEVSAEDSNIFPSLTARDKEVMRNRIALFSRK